MAAVDREIFIDLTSRLRIRYRRSESPPPIGYAITVELLEAGSWVTIRLWDNSDDPAEHHEHAYKRGAGKQPAEILEAASTNEAMAVAITKARSNAANYVQTWEAEER
jgi:hypothetical protein